MYTFYKVIVNKERLLLLLLLLLLSILTRGHTPRYICNGRGTQWQCMTISNLRRGYKNSLVNYKFPGTSNSFNIICNENVTNTRLISRLLVMTSENGLFSLGPMLNCYTCVAGNVLPVKS